MKMGTAPKPRVMCVTARDTSVTVTKWPLFSSRRSTSTLPKRRAFPLDRPQRRKRVDSSIAGWEERIWAKVCGRFVVVLLY
jgi:hypothetical protein